MNDRLAAPSSGPDTPAPRVGRGVQTHRALAQVARRTSRRSVAYELVRERSQAKTLDLALVEPRDGATLDPTSEMAMFQIQQRVRQTEPKLAAGLRPTIDNKRDWLRRPESGGGLIRRPRARRSRIGRLQQRCAAWTSPLLAGRASVVTAISPRLPLTQPRAVCRCRVCFVAAGEPAANCCSGRPRTQSGSLKRSERRAGEAAARQAPERR